MRLSFVFIFIGLISAASIADAAKLKAACTEEDRPGASTEGLDFSSKYEIGSVSKVITTYWAVSQYGLQHKFSTRFRLWNLGDNLWDLHIQGSHDPFFGKQAFQVVVAALNKLGIKKIRKLTFDSGFKYFIDPSSLEVARGYYAPADPVPVNVMSSLRRTTDFIMNGYQDLISSYQKILPEPLPIQIELSVQEISFQETISDDMLKSAMTYDFLSVSLLQILKEMNRISNNHVANQIFESLGGAREFDTFISAKMNLTKSDLIMYNGSGDRYEDLNQGKLYNLATCATVLRVLKELRSEIKKQDGAINLENILAVVGVDEGSTVNTYNNDLTKAAVVAKTGTVNPAVSLAGFVSSVKGLVFFTYISGTDGSVADWREGRLQILTELLNLMKNNDGKKDLLYHANSFVPFDSDSKLWPIGTEHGGER